MINEKLTFDEIFLSRKDMRFLKKSAKASVPAKLCANLLRLGFVEEVKNHTPGYLAKSNGTARISNLGMRYLSYINGKNEDRCKEHLHDWLIAIFSSVAGALLSRPIWDGIEWLSKWVNETS